MLIIGISGGSGSGKSTVVKKIIERLPQGAVTIIPQDAYYRDNGQLSPEEKVKFNFDHPSSIEFPLMNKHLNMLKHRQTIERPVYSYITCARAKETVTIIPSQVIIVEGILIFTNPGLRNKMNIKAFVDADADDRLIRIIRRDVIERGRDYEKVLEHYECYVKPMHLQFIEPTKRYADIIIPQGGANEVAIDILVSRIMMKLSGAHGLQAL